MITKRQPNHTSVSILDVGAEITPEAVEFGKAMDRYKREAHRPYPTWSEVLDVIHALGYRRVDSEGE